MNVFLMTIAIGFLVPSTLILIAAIYTSVRGLLEISVGKFAILYVVFVLSLALFLYLLQ